MCKLTVNVTSLCSVNCTRMQAIVKHILEPAINERGVCAKFIFVAFINYVLKETQQLFGGHQPEFEDKDKFCQLQI